MKVRLILLMMAIALAGCGGTKTTAEGEVDATKKTKTKDGDRVYQPASSSGKTTKRIDNQAGEGQPQSFGGKTPTLNMDTTNIP